MARTGRRLIIGVMTAGMGIVKERPRQLTAMAFLFRRRRPRASNAIFAPEVISITLLKGRRVVTPFAAVRVQTLIKDREMLIPERTQTREPSTKSASPAERGRHAAWLRQTRTVLEDLFGPPAARTFAVRFWEGTVDAPAAAPSFTLVLQHPGALRRMLVPPSELTLIESYVFDDIDIAGNLEAAANLGDLVARRIGSTAALLRLFRHVTALPATAEPSVVDSPAPESTTRSASGQSRQWDPFRALRRFGRAHSVVRDRQAVRFHYDVGNDFYALWLDRRLVYSCAYFERGSEDLGTAQEAKLDLVCRKLRLRPGERLLDVGCGWGALILHAAARYGVSALGITLSESQAKRARELIAAAGLSERCRVEIRDYRQLAPEESFDKIVSVGMVEHVGAARLEDYFTRLHRALAPRGLLLNHGIVSIAASRPPGLRDRVAARLWRRNAFIERYVFPDGRLVPAASVIASAERAGFETRDIESLREHYTNTLRHWTSRLEAHATEAINIVGVVTYRVWRLYMAASAYGFRTGRIGILQTLLAKPDGSGDAGLPWTRRDLYEAPLR